MARTLITERLRLEPLTRAHTEAVLAYELRNREHLRRWEPSRDESFYTIASIEKDIDRAMAFEADERGVRFAVFELGGNEIVAIVNLWEIRRGVIHNAILGYAVDARYQGRGFATEAASAVVRYAFDELNLHRLETSFQPENKASGNVLRKLGFEVIGYAREHLFINGAWRDGVLVALINSNWTAPG